MLPKTLDSLLEANRYYSNWFLVVSDDGSDIPAEPIVRDKLKGKEDQFVVFASNMSMEEKIRDGLRLGLFLNAYLDYFTQFSDIWITLCDDDLLYPTYLRNLNRFFLSKPEVMYCYSNIHLYNPLNGTIRESYGEHFNDVTEPQQNLFRLVDSSQVAFRSEVYTKYGARYPSTTKASDNEPFKLTPDGEFLLDVAKKGIPAARYTGFVSQYKGIHNYQMVRLKEFVFKDKTDILSYKDELL